MSLAHPELLEVKDVDRHISNGRQFANEACESVERRLRTHFGDFPEDLRDDTLRGVYLTMLASYLCGVSDGAQRRSVTLETFLPLDINAEYLRSKASEKDIETAFRVAFEGN